MSDFVQIKPTGLFICGPDDEGTHRRVRVAKSQVLTHLRTPCYITEGTTLRDLFRMAGSYKHLLFFLKRYSWCRPIHQFRVQIEEPIRSNDADPLDFLEVCQRVEFSKIGGGEGIPPALLFSRSIRFHGIGRAGRNSKYKEIFGETTDPDQMMPYSIAYAPLYDLADLTIRLNPELNPLSSMTKCPVPTITEFTLLEMLDAIFWELGFNGGPERKAALLDEMNAFVAEIEAGTVQGYSSAEVIRALESQGGTIPSTLIDDLSGKVKVVVSAAMVRQLGLDPDQFTPIDFLNEGEEKTG